MKSSKANIVTARHDWPAAYMQRLSDLQKKVILTDGGVMNA
jgi:hypothetical protein